MLKAASIAEIKAELQTLPEEELLAICLRLARFKKDNKELLGFLLFDAHQIDHYTQELKTWIDEEFATVNTSNVFFAKKTIRKILRGINKYVKYTGSKEMEAALLIHFLQALKQLPQHILKATILDNMMRSQQQKARKAIASLHEDLQYDLKRQLATLEI
ncbi:MAG TPA: hypothetical protein VLC98_14240 [Phnomibacter sp.]|nr:hypothetical protein [Phnomibacter sp.]